MTNRSPQSPFAEPENFEALAFGSDAPAKKNGARRMGPPPGPGGPGPGGPPPGAPSEKAKNFKGTIGKLIKLIAQFKVAIVAAVIFAIASTVFNILGPKVLSTATTELFAGINAKLAGTGGIDFTTIGFILLVTLVLYVFSSACSFAEGWVMSKVVQRVCFDLRERISHKINALPMSYFEKTSTGDVLSRITNDVDTLGQNLNQSITQLITSTVTIVGVVAMMLYINAFMTLVALIIVPISLVVTAVVVKHSQKHFRAQQNRLGVINAQVEETFSGHSVVKAFNKEASAVAKFERTNEQLYEAAWKSQFLSGLMPPLMTFISNAGYVAIAVLGAWFAIQGRITVGDIQAFIQYIKNFTQPITQLAQISNVLQQMAAAAERVFEFLESPEEVNEPDEETSGFVAKVGSFAPIKKQGTSAAGTSASASEAGKALATPGQPAAATGPARQSNQPTDITSDAGIAVEFRDITFSYVPGKPVITNFSATVKPGQTVAIVGPTGAGKTTIVKLLMRFYDPDSGAIYYNGYNAASLARSTVRNGIGMVLQDTWLFKGSVRDNIAYGVPDATNEQVQAAAKAAFADQFIRTLPQGYDTEINEDASNISQGQRQLLTIARALLANRPILILDEATSSVDTRTEVLIQKAMDELMRGRTSFVVAHRLSTIRNADLILVMNEGNIVESGTHETLLAQGGFYATLYNSQFEDR